MSLDQGALKKASGPPGQEKHSVVLRVRQGGQEYPGAGAVVHGVVMVSRPKEVAALIEEAAGAK